MRDGRFFVENPESCNVLVYRSVTFSLDSFFILRRLKNHSAENEKSFGADFYDVNYQVVANCLPNVFFRSGT